MSWSGGLAVLARKGGLFSFRFRVAVGLGLRAGCMDRAGRVHDAQLSMDEFDFLGPDRVECTTIDHGFKFGCG